jgi:hypothetical protein
MSGREPARRAARGRAATRGAALLVLALAALAGASCGGRDGHAAARPGGGQEADGRGYAVDLGARGASFDRAGWRTDFERHTVPLAEIHRGGPGRDGIPPIDRPKVVGARQGDRYLAAGEPVIVVGVAGAARAYPVRALVWHEVVNDRLSGRPIAVTYSPLCNSTRVFAGRVGGRPVTFGTTGNLRRSNPLLWDRRTESWWQQMTGEAVVGALAGARLAPLPAETLSWARFKRRHPHGTVLARPRPTAAGDYSENPYLGYDDPRGRPHLLREHPDPRLLPKERIVALLGARPPVAVPFSRLAHEPVVEVAAGSTPAVVLYERGVPSAIDADSVARSKDVGTAGAFDRRLRDRLLSFERRGGAFVDRETGSEWDVTGRAVAGRLRGSQLRPLLHDEPFWFGLAAFAPDVRIAAGGRLPAGGRGHAPAGDGTPAPGGGRARPLRAGTHRPAPAGERPAAPVARGAYATRRGA